MIREILKPNSEFYNLHIPKEYIGKDIEVIVLPLFNLDKSTQIKEQKKQFDPKEFYALTTTSKSDIDEYLAQNNSDWEK